MAFFRNILSNKRADVDVEIGIIQLDDMETDNGPAHSLSPDRTYALNRGSTSPFLFPAPNAVPNTVFPLLPSAEIGTTITNANGKRSQNDDRMTKVRVVEQESRLSKMVCLYFYILKCIALASIESDWKAI